MGFKSREVRICGRARVGYSGERKKRKLSCQHCREWCTQVVGTQLGWDTLGFESREVRICGRVDYSGEKNRN
jgi:hypothetical protein